MCPTNQNCEMNILQRQLRPGAQEPLKHTLYNQQTSKLQYERSFGVKNQQECVYCIRINPTGTKLATTNSDFTLRLFDIQDSKGKLLHKLPGHEEIITSLSWFPTGEDMMVTGSLDKTIRVWKDQKSIAVLKDHSDWIRCLTISSSSDTLLSGCVSSSIYGWDLATCKVKFKIHLKKDDNYLNSINSIDFSKQNEQVFASAARDGFMSIFDTRAGLLPQFQFLTHGTISKSSKMNTVEYGQDGTTILTSGRDSTIKLWDIRNLCNVNLTSDDDVIKFNEKMVIRQFNQHKCVNYNLGCQYYKSERYVLTGSEDKFVYVYDTMTGELIKTLQGHTSVVHLVHAVETSPEPIQIASCSIESSQVHFWKPNRSVPSKPVEFEKQMIEPKDRTVIEKMIEKHGDRMLEMFHKHNFTFSSGSMEQFLANILQHMVQNGPNSSESVIFTELLQGLSEMVGEGSEGSLEEEDELEEVL
jgi:WD40 repeat protein